METKKGTLIKDIKRQKYIYLMIFIPLAFYAVFKQCSQLKKI